MELDDLERAMVRNGFRPLPDRFATWLNGRSSAERTSRSVRSHARGEASVEELRLVSHDRVFERYGLAAEGVPPIIV